MDGVRKEQQQVRAKIKQLDDALKAIDNDIKTLQDELTSVTEKRGKAHESIQQLRKNRDEGVCLIFQSYQFQLLTVLIVLCWGSWC